MVRVESRERRGRAEIWDISNSSLHLPSLHPQHMFPSLAGGSGYQLFNYFQIVELRSGLNKSH